MAGCAAAACFRKLAKSVGAGCAWASASSAGFLRVSAPAAPLHARAMLMARARVEALNGWFFMVVGLSMNAEAARIRALQPDRKSTRLNSSHSQISYAVFCLKKKKKHKLRLVT